MDENLDPVSSFDQLYTTNKIKIIKILLPYLSYNQTNIGAAYIKLMEYLYCINEAPKHTYNLKKENNANPINLIDTIAPFCDTDFRNSLLNIKNTLENIQNMKEMFDLFETMQTFNGDDNSTEEPFDGNFSNILNLFGDIDGLQNIFDMFSESSNQ